MVTTRSACLVAGVLLLANVEVCAQTAPTVTLTAVCTAPCNQTATVTLTATATAASGRTVSKVEFYDGANLLIADTTNPYSSTRTGITGGSHSFTAKAYDNGTPQLSTVSTARVVAVNAPPTVSLTAACNASPCVAGSTVSLSASPADPDGVIAKVEFYQGMTLLTTRTAAPWSTTTAALVAGSYNFTAKAFDNGTTALSTTSSAQAVAVTAPPPTVSLAAVCTVPCNQAATVTLAASVTAASGRNIARVEFYDGSTLLTTVTASPYLLSRTGVVGGTHAYTAKAYDNGTPQLSASSAIQSIAVNTPPTVSLATSCVAPCTAPAAVTLTATAADVDGTVTRVEFYRGATLIGTRTAAPWIFVDTAPAGANSYTARAFDSATTPLTTTSAARSVTVGAATTALVPITIDGAAVAVSLPGALPPTLTFSAQAGDVLSLRVTTDGLYDNLSGAMLPLGTAKNVADFTGSGDSSTVLFDGLHRQFYYQNGSAKEVVALRHGFMSLLVRQTGTYSVKLVDYGTSAQTIGFQLLRAADAPVLTPNSSFDTDTQHLGQPIHYRFVPSTLGDHFAMTLRSRTGWMDGPTPHPLRILVFRPDGTVLQPGANLNGDYLFARVTSNGDQHFVFELRAPSQAGEYRVLLTPQSNVSGGATAFARRATSGGGMVVNGPEAIWTPQQSPADGVYYQFQAVANVEYTLVARTTEMPPQYRHPSVQVQDEWATYHVNLDCCAGVDTPLVGTTKFTLASGGAVRISIIEPQDDALGAPIRFSLLTDYAPNVQLATTNSATVRRNAPYYYNVEASGLGNMAVDRIAVYAYLTGMYRYDRFEIGSCPATSANGCSLIWDAKAPMRPGAEDPRPRSIYPAIIFANGLVIEGATVDLQNALEPGLVADPSALRESMLIADDQVSFRGSVTGPKNISVFVNGDRVPTRPGGEFVANNVALSPGQNTITVLAVTLHETRTYTVNVYRNGQAPFAVEALYEGGLSPLSTVINVYNRSAAPWVRVGIDIDGDGVDDQTIEPITGSSVALPFTLISRAAVRVTVYGAGNAILHRTVRYLLPHHEQDASGAAMEVHADLAADLETFASARSYEAFTFAGLTKFKPVIQAFGGGLANASMWLGTVEETTLAGSRCEIKVRRLANGNWKVFRIQMLRDTYDGLWRVADM